MTKRVMVIDALNMYFRAYIVDPSLSTNGEPIGGIKGFIKILQKMCREMKPDQIVICWDGAGGSNKRRAQNKNYKSGRKPIRLNRSVRNMSLDEETENKIWQQTELFGLLNHMPIIQFIFPEVEADDVISAVVQAPAYEGWQKVIISSDKDFLQLLGNDDVVLYRPIQKQFLNRLRVVEDYGIHPTNFAMARAMVGDPSDNLAGIRGIGLPTVAKRLSFLQEGKSFTFSDIYEHCEKTENKLKIHTNILENKAVIEDNYKRMQLYSPAISVQSKEKIKYTLENADMGFNKTGMTKIMYEIGFGELNWSDLAATMRRISLENSGE